MRNRIYIFILVTLFPLLVVAQASGGQIRRNTQVKPIKPSCKKLPNAEKDRIIQDIISNMVYVEGGTFMMGGTSEQGNDTWNLPKAHQENVSSFKIGRYLVTQKEWVAIMGKNPSKKKGNNYPVDNISIEDCKMFVSILSKITNQDFSIPTDIEWEFAARGGNLSKKYTYAGSNDLNAVGWHGKSGIHNGNSDGIIHEVGQKLANELGLYDMSGNVYEWCKSIFDGEGNKMNNWHPELRGGAYYSENWRCRVSFPSGTGGSNEGCGLRIVLYEH